MPSLDEISLFLDLDGTLLEFADSPQDVVADAALRALLAGLGERLAGRLAIISGRSIAQIDDILGPLASQLALSGSHGTEHRWPGIEAHPVRPAALDEVSRRFRDFAQGREGVIVEDKSYGVALHFRLHPDAQAEALALADALARSLELRMQPGKMMAEVRLPGGDKGRAIATHMARAPLAGTRPWFLGDDETDEPGFVTARSFGGAGILVGTPRETAALYHLPHPTAVRDWLASLLA